MKRPRIFLVDDHSILLEAFRHLLEPKFEVFGTATDGKNTGHPQTYECLIYTRSMNKAESTVRNILALAEIGVHRAHPWNLLFDSNIRT